ncbi:MAG: proline--tRNA ligase [Anaerolineae bacterium]|nr:proline--tRNA ligase [Thermoflexales bacterium]MDW8406167.1 proline--tRNA ligase [Anaerolineae bacterium]
MRLSKSFGQTLREAPADAEAAGYRLLLRAGYIRSMFAGNIGYLPLGRRALNKIEAVVREEMNAIGGQEITLPIAQPKDTSDRDMSRAVTDEEAAIDLARREVRSYRQLPQLLYHIRLKWRDDPRPRAGLMYTREFTLLSSYSFDADEEGLNRQYDAHCRAYARIFERCGLSVVMAVSDAGAMGETVTREYVFLNPIGENVLLLCGACGYIADQQTARFRKPPADPAHLVLPIQKVATPGATTIEALAAFLRIPKSKTAKAVFLVADPAGALPPNVAPLQPDAHEFFVFAVVRGDMEISETKLAAAVGARALRPASVDEIRAIGAEPGYGSPVGVDGAYVVVDDAIPLSPNLVAGANEAGYHLLNVNYGRDYQAAMVCDIAAAQAGDACPECGAPLQVERGVPVGCVSKLGARYSQAIGATVLDKDGRSRPIFMGSYRIEVGRLLACIAEAHHDEYGLKWPASVAPYHVHLVSLRSADGSVEEKAEQLYRALWAAGIETVWDDRDERPGVKFNDADLIGLPLRITVGERALKAGQIEVKRRADKESLSISTDADVASVAREMIWGLPRA